MTFIIILFPLFPLTFGFFSSLHYLVLESIWPFGTIHMPLAWLYIVIWNPFSLAPTFVKGYFLRPVGNVFQCYCKNKVEPKLQLSSFTCSWPSNIFLPEAHHFNFKVIKSRASIHFCRVGVASNIVFEKYWFCHCHTVNAEPRQLQWFPITV